jgi:pre-mRNA-splicing helicase BRR2
MWSTQSPLRQLEHDIPDEVISKLENKDIIWERLYDLNPSELGDLIKLPKLGIKNFNKRNNIT